MLKREPVAFDGGLRTMRRQWGVVPNGAVYTTTDALGRDAAQSGDVARALGRAALPP